MCVPDAHYSTCTRFLVPQRSSPRPIITCNRDRSHDCYSNRIVRVTSLHFFSVHATSLKWKLHHQREQQQQQVERTLEELLYRENWMSEDWIASSEFPVTQGRGHNRCSYNNSCNVREAYVRVYYCFPKTWRTRWSNSFLRICGQPVRDTRGRRWLELAFSSRWTPPCPTLLFSPSLWSRIYPCLWYYPEGALTDFYEFETRTISSKKFSPPSTTPLPWPMKEIRDWRWYTKGGAHNLWVHRNYWEHANYNGQTMDDWIVCSRFLVFTRISRYGYVW